MNNIRRHNNAVRQPRPAPNGTARILSSLALCAAVGLASATPARAVNVTVSAVTNGNKTPEIVGYNSGHFMPNSNTADWWRFSGVNGARVWPTPTVVEASDDLAPWGDNVNSQATFVTRRDNLRASPLSSTYINWPYFEGRYQNNPTTGANIINLKYAFGQLHNLNIDPVVQISYTNGSFPWDPAGHHRWLGRPLGAMATLLCPGVLPGEELRRPPLPDVQRAERRRRSRRRMARAAALLLRCRAGRRRRREPHLRQIAWSPKCNAPSPPATRLLTTQHGASRPCRACTQRRWASSIRTSSSSTPTRTSGTTSRANRSGPSSPPSRTP